MKADPRAVKILLDYGLKDSKSPRVFSIFTKNEEADKLLNNIEHFPHLYTLACLMDRQMPAERAWLIPYKVGTALGGFEFSQYQSASLEVIKGIFLNQQIHRFNETMSEIFFSGIRRIESVYSGNAANIWNDRPESATAIRRFLEFKGVGIKIATMAVNILSRDFKIEFKDKRYIDMSPDIMVRRVFKRLGIIEDQENVDALIYAARELYPDYPGVFDYRAWEIGRKWCHPTKPNCGSCYLKEYCLKIL